MEMNGTTGGPQPHRKAVIGDSSNFWLYSSRTGFDLSHPASPYAPPIRPRLTFSTTASPITVDPAKTALVVIDMQNFFLSPAFGRDVHGAGHKALKQLVDNAIPAARKAGVRVVWVNWGLTRGEIDEMPPTVKRAFGLETVVESDGEVHGVIHGSADGGKDAVFEEHEDGIAVDKLGTPRHPDVKAGVGKSKTGHVYKGLGSSCGIVKDPETGKDLDAGKLLMRDQWNSALFPPLGDIYDEGTKLASRPDVWIHKNRMSGIWGPGTELESFLDREGIKTLLFTGVNTDQCVGGTLQDACSKGYDCVLLSDGSGTTSPAYAQQCMEYNAAGAWGFLSTCEQFAEGATRMLS